MSRESDKKVPIAILFGPEACGKTCLLFRLLSWLREIGFRIIVDSLLFNFDSYDITQFILENWRAKSSNYFSDLEGFHWPILLDIISHKGDIVAKIYYQPGCMSFNRDHYTYNVFPNEFHHIIELNNPKKWIIFTELESELYEKEKYCEIIKNLKYRYILPKDKIIILCNKIDRNYSCFNRHKPMFNMVLCKLRSEYPLLFDIFKNNNPITKLFKPYTFSLAIFSSGYECYIDNHHELRGGSDYYPEQLWKLIIK